ncbi:exported hypothetical protein [Bradyrhizobium sp. ORS 375]|uniref:hypothetical protein n=1 Tax=Bradyrhizobium sp. (strain ORS 375) TaxID=566679 RepID=UPI000240965C|nr:hypothetical protein [Bradyrhizobium sp. ORS 375]CCD92778.1 exported hypothetical protein [Bradyrhizobium sp. ORS 375]
MSERLLTIVATAALIAGLSSAHASLLTSPIGLKPAVDASRTMTRADLQAGPGVCVLRTDDVFAGPVALWTC